MRDLSTCMATNGVGELDDVVEALDASSLTKEELAAAASRSAGHRVELNNLRVRHRKRKGAKLFFLITEAGSSRGGGGGTFEIQLSAMLKKSDDRTGGARLGAEVHAAAYQGAAPGATIARVWGVLEQRTSAGVGGGGVGDADAGADGEGGGGKDGSGGSQAATRRCHNCGVMSCAGAALNGVCPSSGTPVLRVEGIQLFNVGEDAPVYDAKTTYAAGTADAVAESCWIVFDMAYDDTMTTAEHGALSRQVSMCVAANKRAKHPFLIAVASDNPADDEVGGVGFGGGGNGGGSDDGGGGGGDSEGGSGDVDFIEGDEDGRLSTQSNLGLAGITRSLDLTVAAVAGAGRRAGAPNADNLTPFIVHAVRSPGVSNFFIFFFPSTPFHILIHDPN